MLHLPLEELGDAPQWQNLLAAYCEEQAAAKAANDQHSGWVPRIKGHGEMQREELSQLHGRLIALGLLSFELEGRSSGMSYQVTPLGLRALSGPVRHDDDDAADLQDAADDFPAQAA